MGMKRLLRTLRAIFDFESHRIWRQLDRDDIDIELMIGTAAIYQRLARFQAEMAALGIEQKILREEEDD